MRPRVEKLREEVVGHGLVLARVRAGRDIAAVVLDVRGTVISATDDEPISEELSALIREIRLEGVHVAFVSGGSLETLRELVLSPLARGRGTAGCKVPMLAYVNSATEGFAVREMTAEALDGYAALRLTEERQSMIRDLLLQLTATSKIETNVKEKPGQLNFYCKASWGFRRDLARSLRRELAVRNLERRIHVLTPSAREVLDIAASTKARAIGDLRRRLGLAGHQLLVIGDSFQPDGSDVAMLRAAPDAIAVHVGAMKPVRSVIKASSLGPTDCERTLSELLEALRGGAAAADHVR